MICECGHEHLQHYFGDRVMNAPCSFTECSCKQYKPTNPSERIEAAREFYNQRLENTDDLMRTVDLMADYADERTATLAEENKRLREYLSLIDVDEDGIFNVWRDGKLIGYGGNALDAVLSAVANGENK